MSSGPTPDAEKGPETRRDSLDFRDLIYRPALIALEPELLPNQDFIHISNQGEEGTCTGFGLAAVINYLLRERGEPADQRVSARMLYEMAKRHDYWPGQDYEGSSARGAMKGWYKNGVCSEEAWPYDSNNPGYLTTERQMDALGYPLGAYYRIQRRRSELHSALHEVRAVFATAQIHSGWHNLQDGVIPFSPGEGDEGGHAFAIIGYTQKGFIIQNSWGEDWGGVSINGIHYAGCAIWTYADFDHNLWDAWVARLALPLESMEALMATAIKYVERPGGTEAVALAPPRPTIRDYYIHIDDGRFDPLGDYYSEPNETREIINRVVEGRPEHILLYAHGGLNPVESSAARVGKWRPVFEKNGIHAIHFLWETGLWEEIADLLRSKLGLVERRAAAVSDWWDRIFEQATQWAGSALWKEMRSGAESAFLPSYAGDQSIAWLIEALKRLPEGDRPRLHLAGHSAGSIWLGHLLHQWEHYGGLPINNLILFAPACTHEFFASHIKPPLARSVIKELHHFLLDDETERDDNVSHIYHKSLLYLVSRSYQQRDKVAPLMGMAKHLDKLPIGEVKDRVKTYIAIERSKVSASTSHGGFDNDVATMNSLLELVLGRDPVHLFQPDDLQGY